MLPPSRKPAAELMPIVHHLLFAHHATRARRRARLLPVLQAATASSHPILLLYDTKSGHSGGRPINKQIEENTDILSFLFWQLGVPTN